MLNFLQDFIPTWTSTTATRLVDACDAHLVRKTEELRNAELVMEHHQQNSEQSSAHATACELKLETSKQDLKKCVLTQQRRLQSLAKAIMAVSSSTDEDNIETIRQVLDMASASSSDSFLHDVGVGKGRMVSAEQELKAAEESATEACFALRAAKDDKEVVEKQIKEIETIRNQLRAPSGEEKEKLN